MTMKSIVSDTMKCNPLPFLFLLALPFLGLSQAKYEREFRIKESQFPVVALENAQPYLDGVKRLRFYKEIDSSRQSFEIKFKKDRLHYSVEYSSSGVLEDIEVTIRQNDIPNESWDAIIRHLSNFADTYKVRKIQQQYPRDAFATDSATFRNAFQNLLLPEMRYELMIQARKGKTYKEFEILYDSGGGFLQMRESLPPNYDHVLY
jgi:hypothetical protein